MVRSAIAGAAGLVVLGIGAAAMAEAKDSAEILLDPVTYVGEVAQVPVTVLNLSAAPLPAQIVSCDFMAQGAMVGRATRAIPALAAGGRDADVVTADVGGVPVDAVRCEMSGRGAALASFK